MSTHDEAYRLNHLHKGELPSNFSLMLTLELSAILSDKSKVMNGK